MLAKQLCRRLREHAIGVGERFNQMMPAHRLGIENLYVFDGGSDSLPCLCFPRLRMQSIMWTSILGIPREFLQGRGASVIRIAGMAPVFGPF